ncbi:MAG: transposase [Chloroflexota bacterium]
MIRSHQIRLNPTPEQETYFYKAAGTARYAYNWAVEKWRVIEGKKPSTLQLKKQFNAIKPEWAYEVTKCAAEGGFMAFGDAVSRFFKGQNGEPQFKSRNRGHFSFYLANDKFRVSGHWIRVPKLGWVNMAEKLRFHGKILKAQIRKHGTHWFASISLEMPDKVVKKKNTACGIDVGISHLATLSDNTIYDNVRPLKNHLHRLANLQRVLARKAKGSRNRERIKRKIRQLHQKIRNIRDDVLHKMTTHIACHYDVVVMEDLNVKGMTKNHRLAQALQDASLGRVSDLIASKVQDRHGIYCEVGRFFPSSKLCSCPECDGKRDDLTLSERTYECPQCGLMLDRDHNAARNILQEGLRILRETEIALSGSGYDGHKTPPQTGYNPNISPCGGGVHFCIP